MSLARLRRWLTEPLRPVRPRFERWSCPDCGAEVQVPSSSPTGNRAEGFWLPPGEPELRRLCEQQHGGHGSPPSSGT